MPVPPTPNSLTLPPLSLHLFGPFEVLVNGQPMPRPRSHAGQAILALLALQQERPVERTWLASLLWPDSGHEQALFNLRRNLTDLRQILGSESGRLLSPSPRSLHFDLQGARCDLTEFDSLVQRTESEALEAAIALYRGPLLVDCSEEWVGLERSAREESYLTALETLADRALRAERPQEAVPLLRRALAVNAFREAALCSLLRGLAATGDLTAATLAYREFRLLLHRELRTEPTPETLALYQSLRARTVSPPQPAIPPLPSENASPPHLPQPIYGLVGRVEEIQEVQECLERARLVTLTGTGGVGKTRLAIAVARESADDFADGVWFVDLAPLTEPEFVAYTIATSLQIHGLSGPSATEALIQSLASKSLLIVLDNCEHIIEACAYLVHRLLPACPSLRVLATSRQPLGVRGESVWRVPSLALPTDHADAVHSPARDPELYPAVKLFVERARAAESSFRLTPLNARSIVEICRKLDGIPLAIELAAARVRSLTVEDIHSRLEKNLALLTAGGARLLPRHETLAAAFAWSWDLLPFPERVLLGRLCVFAGGWTLDAAEAICVGEGIAREAIVDLLTSLVDRSLVLYWPVGMEEGTAARGTFVARYHLLETTRQFAAEWLCESGMQAAIHTRHRDHFLAWAEEVKPRLWGEDQAVWFGRLEADHNNLRTALEWCRKQKESVQELRLAVALSRFWDTHGHLREGRARLEAALVQRGDDVPDLLYADALVNAGWMAQVMGDMRACCDYYERALPLFRHLGIMNHLSGAMNFLACARRDAGDLPEALRLFEEARTICLRHNQKRPLVPILTNLGATYLGQGDLLAARVTLEEAVALCREQSFHQLLGVALYDLAVVAFRQGRFQEAQEHNNAGLRIYSTLRSLVNIPDALVLTAALAAQEAKTVRATRLLGAATRLRQSLDVPMEPFLESDLNATTVMARRALGEEGFAMHFAEGLTMEMEDVVAYALNIHTHFTVR